MQFFSLRMALSLYVASLYGRPLVQHMYLRLLFLFSTGYPAYVPKRYWPGGNQRWHAGGILKQAWPQKKKDLLVEYHAVTLQAFFSSAHFFMQLLLWIRLPYYTEDAGNGRRAWSAAIMMEKWIPSQDPYGTLVTVAVWWRIWPTQTVWSMLGR